MTSTHSASPLPVAAALATLDVLEQEHLIEHAAAMEKVLLGGLTEIQRRWSSFLGCVRVKGMVAGVQVVKPGTRSGDAEKARAIHRACFQKGLLMFAPVGVRGECLKICPPLATPQDALCEGIQAFAEAVAELPGET